MFHVVAGQPNCESIRYGNVKRASDPYKIVIAHIAFDVAFKFAELCSLRDQVYRPATCVAAVERTLRPLEHLDARKVVQRRRNRGRVEQIDPVYAISDSGFLGSLHVERTDPANVSLNVCAAIRKLHARDGVLDLAKVRKAVKFI